MNKNFTYQTQGICCRQISVEVVDGKIENVNFLGGCHGNLQGIAALIQGMPADQVITRLKGIDCKGRGTSCPDQLALALEQNL